MTTFDKPHISSKPPDSGVVATGLREGVSNEYVPSRKPRVFGGVAEVAHHRMVAGEARHPASGEILQLALGGSPSQLGTRLQALEEVGCVVEVRKDEGTEETTSSIRFLAEYADTTLPEAMEVLDGTEVLSVDTPGPPSARFSSASWKRVKRSKGLIPQS